MARRKPSRRAGKPIQRESKGNRTGPTEGHVPALPARDVDEPAATTLTCRCARGSYAAYVAL